MPTLNDNNYILTDSHAICPYLVGKYAADEALYPKELQVRAKINQRLHFDTDILFHALENGFVPILYEGACKIKPSTLVEIENIYELLEKFLNNQAFLVSDIISVADFSCITSITQLDIIYPINDKFVNIQAWINRIAQLPYYDELNGKVIAEIKVWIESKVAENRAKMVPI